MSARFYAILSASDTHLDERYDITQAAEYSSIPKEVDCLLIDNNQHARTYYCQALAIRISVTEVHYLFTKELAKKYGVDEGTLRLIWKDFVSPLTAPSCAIWIDTNGEEAYYGSIAHFVSLSFKDSSLSHNFLKQQLKAHLIEVAKIRGTTDYTSAGGRIGLKGDDPLLHQLLTEISNETRSDEGTKCYLSVLVGLKRNKNKPSDGFWKLVRAEDTLDDKDEMLRVLKEKVYTAYCS